jgi:hypothetical protein
MLSFVEWGNRMWSENRKIGQTTKKILSEKKKKQALAKPFHLFATVELTVKKVNPPSTQRPGGALPLFSDVLFRCSLNSCFCAISDCNKTA